MNIIHINPCRPFEGMARKDDYIEILVDSMTRGFGITGLARFLLDEAVHHAYQKKEDVIMRDVLEEVWELKARFGEQTAFELCALLNCTVDGSYPEYKLFCDRDGVPINVLDIDAIKAMYRETANRGARGFIENLVLYSLMF